MNNILKLLKVLNYVVNKLVGIVAANAAVILFVKIGVWYKVPTTTHWLTSR